MAVRSTYSGIKKERKDDKRIRHRGTRDGISASQGGYGIQRGAGGAYLYKPGSADTVTLCDIAQAVGAAFVSASWRSGDVDKPCLVASGMGALMDEVYTGLDALCKERL